MLKDEIAFHPRSFDSEVSSGNVFMSCLSGVLITWSLWLGLRSPIGFKTDGPNFRKDSHKLLKLLFVLIPTRHEPTNRNSVSLLTNINKGMATDCSESPFGEVKVLICTPPSRGWEVLPEEALKKEFDINWHAKKG